MVHAEPPTSWNALGHWFSSCTVWQGNTFERSAIEAWLREHDSTPPITRTPYTAEDLRPNRALLGIITAFNARQK